METTLHAASYADISPASSTIHPTLQHCIVPVAPTCFLLQAGAGTSIAALTAHIHEIAKTYHAYGAANLTFIVSDAQALERAGFFAPAKQGALVGKLRIEVNYIFANEAGSRHCCGASHTLPYWAEHYSKAGAR
ncbi:hypothetical protein IGS59_08265 [Janthinobacterium sp. GW460P]|uniref:hypothetical protein n=1 Tax=unclassified Janthinobacterium TaxID=2610881 RepID=UPI000A325278|nr:MULTISPECIES: hypothetical protein [unclassified Janthinobacterium]MCC7702227.1 hypothetical protein [Janthinobacterium sp. GW460P]MCC7707735.1 hypothetical protein [Janthinobacterium sp. GW460W]